MMPRTKKSRIEKLQLAQPAALTCWDHVCWQVLVWAYALSGPRGQRRIPEHVLGSMPYLQAGAGTLTVSTGLHLTMLYAALSSLNRQGLIARVGGVVWITPKGFAQVRL
jgi:hypothetical protein